MIPKVIFRRSWLYEAHLRRSRKSRKLPQSIFHKRMAGYERGWRKIGPRVLRALERITKLRWVEREIVCYVTATTDQRAYSDPLTLSAWRNREFFFNTLTHELIHRIITYGAPQERLDRNWKRLMKKYRGYPSLTQRHIPVHAVHAVLLKQLFGERALERAIRQHHHPAYIRAWKVAGRDGYENIARELKRIG